VFKILSNGQGDTLERELLTSTKGVLVSDRASALKFWAMHRRQAVHPGGDEPPHAIFEDRAYDDLFSV
ncbi:MAG: hypothetical protein RLZZ450_7066, partial [Pseudomonadota bacterium]|jgi:hypothetical protein